MSWRASSEPASLGLDDPEASRGTLLAIGALGVAFDLTFNGQRSGLAIPLFALLLAASVRTVGRRSASTDVLLSCAVLISIFPAIVADPVVAALDIFAASVLLGIAVTQDLGPILSTGIVGLAQRGIALGRRAVAVPHYLSAPLASPADRGRVRAGLRVALIATPVLALFAALLASGDRVFARVLSSVLPKWNVGNIFAHVVLTFLGVILVGILWRSALGNGDDSHEPSPLPSLAKLQFAEWATVLAGIDLLFVLFVVVQTTYLFGGHHRVNVTPGLTYAEYARSGFFQLTAAAALTVVVILAAWDAGRREERRHERWFRALVTTMVALTGVVLASAVTRLALYEGTFGFTISRFFGYVGIVSIGGVLMWLLAAMWTTRRDRVVAGFLVIAFTALLAVNIVGPDRFVARRNVARFEATGRIDVSYIAWGLGPDAVPVAVGLFGRISPTDAETLRAALCERFDSLGSEPSWRSINRGRAAARRALDQAGIKRLTCGDPGSRRTG